MRRLYVTVFAALGVAAMPQWSSAGSFVAVEQDEPDRVAHRDYYGAGGDLPPVRICIDRSLNAGLATAAEPAVRNVIATFNRFRALPDNTFATGSDTSAPADQVDFETVLLHEFMHANGLDHPNQANNPAGSGPYFYYDSRSSDGANGVLDHLGDADGLPGSADDQRGDDVNLTWYVRGSNDPAVLPAVVDTTTMARVLDDLPPGQHFAANGNAAVMAALGHPNSKAVAVQGYVQGRVARHLHSDDLAMLRLARAGIDGIAGTSDDYRSTAVFAGYFDDPQGGECSIVVRFSDDVAFASTLVGLTPLAPNHWRLIYPTRMRFNPAVNWYFTPGANTIMQIDPATPGTSIGVTPYPVHVTVGKAGFNLMSGTPRGTVVVRDGDRDSPQAATCTIELTPASGGTGSCMLAPLSAGRRTLTADYLGWGGWDGNTATATHEASGTVAFTDVTHTPSPSAMDVDVEFDWTLAPPVGAPPVQATGNVVVKEAAHCSAAPVDPAHQCTAPLPEHTCSIRFSSAGTRTLQLCYGGDGAIAPAQASVVHTVQAGRATTTGIVGHSPAQTRPFEPYTVQVQVHETPAQGGYPQGAVIVRDGDDADPLTVRCTALLAGTPDEVASCQLASNRAGKRQLTASFADQGIWTGSSSTSTVHAVRHFAIVANNPASVPLGRASSVTVALEVMPFGGTPAPTGTIVVSDGTDSCDIVLPASQCLWRGSSAGTRQLVATWNGDANHPAMTSAPVTQTVSPAPGPYPLWVSQAVGGYPESNASSTGSNQALSADGRFVVFASLASDLVNDDDNGVEDVFVRDQLSGAVRRVSITADGIPGNGPSRLPSISANGRYVAFQSEASNFFPGDGSDKDVFVKDLYSGTLVRATTLANGSAPTSPELAFATTALRSSLSADGRYVAFATYRTLAPGDTNGRVDVYVKDLATGALDLVSSNSADQPGDNHSQFPALSADGRHVAYNSTAGNLVPDFTPNATSNRVFVKDRLTRASTLASATANGVAADGTCNDYPAISADGRVVAFQCSSTNLPSNGWTGDRVFIKELATGAIELAAPGTQFNNSRTPALSADGRYVAFQVGVGASPNYVAVFVKDRQTGQLVNQHVTPGGAAARDELVSWETRMWPSISADGRYVAFQSVASAIAPPDNNAAADVFVRDRTLGLTQRASVAHFGLRNDGDSGSAAISRDGALAFYDSWSTRLIDGDTNGTRDVFLYRTDTGTTTRISTAGDGTPGNAASFAPTLAEAAGEVYFLSAAGNLVPGDTNGKIDVFRKHLADGTIERINLFYGAQSTADVLAPIAASRDGRIVAAASPDGGIVNDRNGFIDILIYRRGSAGGSFSLTPGSNGNSMQPSISDDGRILAFASDATNLGVGGNAVRNVFARNMREYFNIPQPLQLISADAAGVAANGNSEQPAVSADGRYVAFVSWATNLVPGDDNGVADVFIKDVQTGAIERVNTSASGTPGSGGDCASPSFSAGARFVGFVCAQANLVTGGNATPAFYVKDRTTGAVVRLSQTSTGAAADAASQAGSRALGDNGMAVFTSDAGNLAGLDSPLVSSVFLNQYPAAFSATTVSILSTSPTVPEVGRGYTVNVSVTGAGAHPPGGRVRLFDGTDLYPSCEATLTPGNPSTGSCSLATGISGNTTLTANYGGDDANGVANSAPYPLAVQDPVAPAQPVILSAVPGNGSVRLQIGASNIGSPFTGYTATCGPRSQTGPSMPITVTGLQNGVAVTCTVVVHNSIGSSPPSNPATATPVAATNTGITAHTPDPSRVNTPYTVSVAVLGEGMPAPGGDITISDGATSCVATLTPGAPSTGSCALVSASRGNRTLTASFAGDAANTGSTGTAVHAVADVPAAPALTQAAPGNGRATLTFDAPADDGGIAVLDYTATCGAVSVTGPVSPLIVTDLSNGSPTSCTVTARNALGNGPPSNALAVTPATTPGAPRITGTQPGDGSVTLSFEPPVSDGGSAIDYYRAVCSGTAKNGPGSPLTVTGLTNGTAVLCFVSAHNGIGFSAVAGPVSVTPAAPPGAPVLTAVQPGDARVTLVFDPPASNGGSAVLDYTATCGTRSTTGPASPLSVTDLVNDIEVSCHVTARNAASTGAPSNVLNATPAPARVDTTLALTDGSAPSAWGQSLTFTATLTPVAPASTTPTGTLTFNDGDSPIAGCADLALTTATPVTATCTTSALSVGAHAITARYAGDATYAAGLQRPSNTLDHSVDRASSTVDYDALEFVYDGSVRTVAAHIHDEPGTSCLVVPASIGPDAGSTPLTATCDGTNYTATGTATAVISKATATLVLGGLTAQFDGQPHAVTTQTTPANLAVTITYDGVSTPPTGAGQYTVEATVVETNYQGSRTDTLAIAPAATTLTLSSACMRTFVEAQPYTLVATLAGGVNATGDVDFGEGPTVFCSDVPLSGSTATCRTTLSAQGQATALRAPAARYAGDANHLASDAAPFTVTVLGLAEVIFRHGLEIPGDPDDCPIE